MSKKRGLGFKEMLFIFFSVDCFFKMFFFAGRTGDLVVIFQVAATSWNMIVEPSS